MLKCPCLCSILSNPEVMRQLQNLQQQMNQQQMKQQQHEMEEKLRKLQEMKQQEEEFDKHLAQTLPVSALFIIETVNISLGSEKYCITAYV